MSEKAKPASRPTPLLFRAALAPVLFTAAFFYMLTAVTPGLLYERFNITTFATPFEYGLGFFEQFLTRPGGLIEYVSAFLLAWFYYNVWASAIVVALAMLTWLAVRTLFAALKTSQAAPFAWIPAVAVLVAFTRYDLMIAHFLAFTLATFAAAAFIKYSPRGKWVRGIAFVFAFTALYYVAAAAAFVFALPVAFVQLKQKHGITLAAMLITAATVPWIASQMSLTLPATSAFSKLLLPPPWAKTYTLAFYWASIGCVVAAPPVATWLAARRNQKKPSKSGISNYTWLKPTLVTAIVLPGTAASMHFGQVPFQKALLQARNHARHDQWNDIIELGSRNHDLYWDIEFNHLHDRALYETGQLEFQMFRYPQDRQALVLEQEDGQGDRRKLTALAADLMLELGNVNSAEKKLHELFESTGSWPEVLKLLATLNLVKDQEITASHYLKKLTAFPVYAEKAHKLLTVDASRNDQIQHLRTCSLSGFAEGTQPAGANWFEWLLDRNPDNEMAFKYMMAQFLLDNATPQIVRHISRLEHFGRTTVPRYYQQAIVLEIARSKNDNVVPKKWRPSDEVIAEYRRFLAICSQHKDKQSAMQALAPEFGDSYYFYFTFGLSGVSNWQ